MKNFEVIIGIENHVELKTKSKMFAPAPVSFGAEPNTMVSEPELGYPGALPTLNKHGVELSILAVNALGMTMDTLVRFDRKHYFYTDMAKGFQITQQFHPIGRDGHLDIVLDDGTKRTIEIERLHMEEDSAKQTHGKTETFIDYNRAGIGLDEIVTKPVIRSAEEAVKYVEKLRETLLFLGVSDVKMSEGSLRCDTNVSIRPVGSKEFGNKVEVKNINTLQNVKKAIEYEIERQTKLVLAGEEVVQETRRFDEATQTTISMRSKSDAVDYKYFTEPNIVPIQLDQKWVDDIIKNSPELADQKRIRYAKLGLKPEEIETILSSLENTKFFEATLKTGADPLKIVNYIIGDIQSELNNEGTTIDKIALTPENLGAMIKLQEDGTISSKHAKTILPLIMKSNKETPEQIVDRLDLKLLSDPDKINAMLDPIFEKSQGLLSQYGDRPERVTKAIMGQLMAQTHGNVNPTKAMEIIVKKIESSK